ncbi:hypothetical protein ACFV0T_26405 [Streptomyces sp. NPDC059582]|uniref:hypothetical protein n=1 Tax=Streptomyces sp. NPDC059582 TaxID=3346875 RepID=UPI0036B7CDE8
MSGATASIPRVQAFTDFLLDCVKNTPNVDGVQTLEEAGDTRHPFGLAVRIGGAEVRWQVTCQLADGEKHDSPTADVDGDPAPWTDTDVQDGGEEWLAAVIGRARSARVARIERWSTRDSDRVGVTVYFHNGARAFVRCLGRSGEGRRR